MQRRSDWPKSRERNGDAIAWSIPEILALSSGNWICFLRRHFRTRRRRHRSQLISLHHRRWPTRLHLQPRFAVYPFFPSLSLTSRTQICCLWVQIWVANMFLYLCVCEIFIVICLIVECEFIVVWLWSGLNRMCETMRFFFFFIHLKFSQKTNKDYL